MSRPGFMDEQLVMCDVIAVLVLKRVLLTYST